MDQLTAYKVLGLDPDSSPEEIKEAYAALSKQYHPEEEPEKFQEIHEAYVTLTRRKRRGSVENVYQEEPQEEETPQTKPQFDFDRINVQQKTKKESEYAFDDAMVKAQKQAEERLHELALEAAAELKVLASPKYSKKLKAFKAFFEEKKYEPIFRKAEFLERLCDILEETNLKNDIYRYIVDFYRLRGMNLSELSPIGQRLYQILDAKGGMKQNTNAGLYGGLGAGGVALLQILRPALRESELATGIVLGIVGVILLVWLFVKLAQKRSKLLTQLVIAFGLMVSQIAVIMFDAYGTLFGTVDDGNVVAAIVLLLAAMWFLVVIVVSVIKAVVELVKKYLIL